MIIVTGAGGLLGSHVMVELQTNNCIGIDINSNNTNRRILTTEYYNFDLSVFPDKSITLIHLAALNGIRRSFFNPDLYYLHNYLNSKLYIEKFISKIKRIIYPSSCSIYDDKCLGFIDESDPINPKSPYATSKYMLEEFILNLSTKGNIEFVALRLFNILSPNSNHAKNMTNADRIFDMLQYSRRTNTPFQILGVNLNTIDGTPVRDYFHATDAAKIIAHFAITPKIENTVLNVGSGKGTSIKEFIKMYSSYFNVSITCEDADSHPADPLSRISSNRKLLDYLGPHFIPRCVGKILCSEG